MQARVTAAVAPLPEGERADATVLGRTGAGEPLTLLRAGSNGFICLADEPGDDQYKASCYHNSLEPFMARGRELRAEGVEDVDRVRFEEIESGKLSMPEKAALYSLSGPGTVVDSESGEVRGARPLYVLYVPYATGAEIGISEKPASGQPWLMNPGTPKAHIMYMPASN